MTPPPNLQDLIETVRQDAPTDNPLDQLATAAATVAELNDTSDALLGHFVDRCRRTGHSWTEISSALGVTKQAVHKRFAAGIADRIIAANTAPTFERFTSRARSVLKAAQQDASAAGRGPASSADILLALFAEPEGVAAKVLQAMNVSESDVRSAMPPVPDQRDEPADSTFTGDAKQTLRDTLAVAIELGHNYIGTEHLLLGLYGDPESPTASMLTTMGVTEAEARVRILELLRGFQQPMG